MNDGRRVSTTHGMLGVETVYLFDDRVEVGKTDLLGDERLQRVMLQDAQRLETWEISRGVALAVGAASMFIGLLLVAVAIAAESDVSTVFSGFAAGVALLGGGWLVWIGRPNSLTRFRLHGRRGTIEGTIKGGARHRRAVLQEIAERIHARQRAD